MQVDVETTTGKADGVWSPWEPLAGSGLLATVQVQRC